MESLVFLFGLLGNITTGLVYLSPAKTFWEIVMRRTTGDYESIPYICKLVNAYMWVYYGVLKPDSVLVATVNGFGGVAEIAYIIIFLLFAPPRMKARTAIMFGISNVAFPAAVVLVTQLMLDTEQQIEAAGFLSLCFSMVAYASPLSAMKTVVMTKSVEYMPFLLSFMLFINGGVWTVYAMLTSDWFIGIPNGSGFLLGTSQLVLYAIYWKPKASHKVIRGAFDDEHLEDELISNFSS
ncbi:bidirectional sugar transporter SWEET17-like isoform X1 [Rhododendron vialii]|uniref:bidirectional sugar transporter SWEET17-like isoform X1 n=2 Tax=Rhododendron vialii TaxID=182163 RepID=UPI00265D6F20|nr:bidirectional sugar transporter SWEET17-like isoform X1 [Rhododendron vialii]